MENEKAKEIIENYIRAYNNFEIEGMLKDLDEEVVFQNISGGRVNMTTNGIEAFKKQAEEAKQYFKEREQTIKRLQFYENPAEAVAEIDYKGVLATELPGGLKAGDSINLQGKSVFKFRNNKITEITDIS